MEKNLLILIYILSSVSFILGLKMLSHPTTARKGNMVAATGMSLAIFGTIFLYIDSDTGLKLGNYGWIFGGLAIGTVIGTMMAKKVQMTAMPEMVSLFNGMGGACAAIISLIEYDHLLKIMAQNNDKTNSYFSILSIIIIGLIIGSISFAGSIVAWGKLSGIVKDRSFNFQRLINILFLLSIVLTSVMVINNPPNIMMMYLLLILSLLYGVLFVLPIGGADMPVVISLLNSFTGVAAAFGGFLYNNKVMLTGGILVGAAGTLLTILMCKAMNRSLFNVLIGAFGKNALGIAVVDKNQGIFKEISLSDTAMIMTYANKLIIVPGYGLAVAQAQHICHELEKILSDKGVEVTYAIHPVAGRMPGHMNVLLAEADVDYEKLQEMEQVNDDFKNTDVVLILGANDVVNPSAKNDPSSPIFGMPILQVEDAKNIIVNKRSMKPGYAGIENPLFYQPKTSMLFGDAKKVLQDLCTEIKSS